MKLFLLIVIVIATSALAGCARFSTHQTDASQNPKTGETRTITTRASAYTFFSAKSELAKFKASQTDKTQSASVGALSQSADGTNAIALIEAIAKVVQAAKP